MFYRTEAAIDLDAVDYNFENTRKKVPQGVKLLCVIKADAYGHGAVALARHLESKCDFYGVACIEEAIELKKSGNQNSRAYFRLGCTRNVRRNC